MTRPHRALILQGGGALGAYEAGAVTALVSKLSAEAGSPDDTPIFDIVAGSSIGAVNAVILVNSVISKSRHNSGVGQKNIWHDAAGELEKFWTRVIPTLSLLDNPMVRSAMEFWWSHADLYRETSIQFLESLFRPYAKAIEGLRISAPYITSYFLAWPDKWTKLASGEGARRYLEYRNSLNFGTKDVLAAAMPQAADMKFLNPFVPFFWRFDNSPLLTLIQKKHWPEGKPIKTVDTEPRLLLVAVDVQNCSTAVTFDSYPKADGKHYTEYGGDKEKHVIEYDGITPTQLLASMSTHLRYDYPQMMTKAGEKRTFWDGAYLSNTPLREVLHSHRDYWKAKPGGVVPDLEVYIVNLYPAIEEKVPDEPDSIQDREVDIKFHDRTTYDLKIAEMTGDYVSLVKGLLALMDDDPELRDKARALLSTTPAKSHKRNGEERTYEDLLKGRFSIVRSVYVERKDDEDSIFGKAFDFSTSTLSSLFEEGKKEGEKAYENSEADQISNQLNARRN